MQEGHNFRRFSGHSGIGICRSVQWHGLVSGDAIGVRNDVNETVGINITLGMRVFVRVYQYANDTWTQEVDDVDLQGEINAGRMSSALSNHGKRVAIGLQD